MKKVFLIILVLCSTFSVVAQQYDTAVSPLKGEKWWGGLVALGSQMPFSSTTEWYDLGRKNLNNQVVPLLLSSEGRYIWSGQPFRFRLQNDTLLLHSDYEKLNVISAGKTLRMLISMLLPIIFRLRGSYLKKYFFLNHSITHGLN